MGVRHAHQAGRHFPGGDDDRRRVLSWLARADRLAALLHTLGGTLLVAGGTAALNQYIEREMDAVMRRTAARPLPSGTLQPREVLIFGVSTIVVGAAWLLLAVNWLAALVAVATSVLVSRPLHAAEDAHDSCPPRSARFRALCLR